MVEERQEMMQSIDELVKEVQESLEGVRQMVEGSREIVEEFQVPATETGESENIEGATDEVHVVPDEVNVLQHDRKLLASKLLKILDDESHDSEVLQRVVDLIAKLPNTESDNFDLRTHRHVVEHWINTLKAEISFRSTTDHNSGHGA
jgi:uncharacterized protein YoxC